MAQKTVMYYLGFDTAKTKLDWSLIDEQGVEITYGMTPSEVAELVTLLLTITGAYPSVTRTLIFLFLRVQ